MSSQKSNMMLRCRAIFFYLFLYKTIIEFIYVHNISPLYNYSGLTLDINKIGFFISIFYLFVITLFSPKDMSRPSTYLYIMMEVFIFVPTLSYYWLNNQSFIYTSFIVLCSMIISLVLNRHTKSIKFKEEYASVWLKLIFAAYLLIAAFLIIKRGGIDYRAFNLNSIYELRSENSLLGLMGYLLNWCAKVFCPFFVIYYYYRKQKWIMLPILVLQVLLYLSFGNKAFLFSIALIIMCVKITKRGRFQKEFLLCMIGVNITSYMLDILKISDIPRRAIPYRMIYIPVQIQFQYYDFFRVRDKLYFAETIVGKILSMNKPYPDGISYFIGRYYSDSNTFGNANTGVFSDAFANGGFICMLIYTIILGVIFRLIDSITTELPLYTVVSSLSYIMFVLNDTSLLTTLLTGGLGLMILLLLLFNSNIRQCNLYSERIKSEEEDNADHKPEEVELEDDEESEEVVGLEGIYNELK